jgi:hypothetical protein
VNPTGWNGSVKKEKPRSKGDPLISGQRTRTPALGRVRRRALWRERCDRRCLALPYSHDLREQVIRAVEVEASHDESDDKC